MTDEDVATGGVDVGPARGPSLRSSRRRGLLPWDLSLSMGGALPGASATWPAIAPSGRRGAPAALPRLPREHHRSERPAPYLAAWGALAPARSLARASRRTPSRGPTRRPLHRVAQDPAVGEPKGGSWVDAPRQGARGVPPIRRDAAPLPRYPPARMQICSARARSSLPDATPTSTPLASASATRRAASSSRRKRRAISRRAARVTAQAKPAWVP